MGKIAIEHLVKNFNKTKVLKDISLEIEDGSFTTVSYTHLTLPTT